MTEPLLRTCKHCHTEKALDLFTKSVGHRFGRSFKCKACSAAESNARYWLNHEANKERIREWQRAHPERTKETRDRYNQRNAEKVRERQIAARPQIASRVKQADRQARAELSRRYVVKTIVQAAGRKISATEVPDTVVDTKRQQLLLQRLAKQIRAKLKEPA